MSAQERRNLVLQLLTIPAIILVIAYLYYPILNNFYLSLFDIRNFNLQNKEYVGLDNYTRLYEDRIFWRSLRNTFTMTAATIFIQLPIAFLLADALANHVRKRSKFLEGLLLLLLFLPIVLPTPIIAKSWRLFFTGMHGAGYGPFEWITINLGINDDIKSVFDTRTVLLLGEIKTAFWVVVVIQTWARIGFNLLIYRSAIMMVPNEIYESAQLDGAGSWVMLFRITFPLCRSVISITIVLAILGVFQLFDMIWMLTGGGGTSGGPLNTTQVLATYMYTRAFVDLRTGYGAAISMTILVAALTLSFIHRSFFSERQQ